jgi:acetate CoA/acetoacetate CoA-transferase beta subunit
LVTELAVIAFPNGRATLLETGPCVTVAEVLGSTAAELVVPEHVSEMRFDS